MIERIRRRKNSYSRTFKKHDLSVLKVNAGHDPAF